MSQIWKSITPSRSCYDGCYKLEYSNSLQVYVFPVFCISHSVTASVSLVAYKHAIGSHITLQRQLHFVPHM
jgi:hypothetical protein